MRANVKRFCALCLCCVIFATCIGSVTASAAFLAADIPVLVEYFEYLGEFFGDISTEYIDGFADFLVNDTTLGWILPISDDTYYYVNPDDNQLYVSTGGGAGHIAGGERSGGGGRSRDDLYITADMLRAVTADYADRYGPKSTAEYISWRTDSRYADVASEYISFYADGSFCGETLWTLDCYLVPFFFDGVDYYYGTYQYHYYIVMPRDDEGNYTYDSNGKRIIHMYLDYWSMVDSAEEDATTVLVSDALGTLRYLDIYLRPGQSSITYPLYDNYVNYISRKMYRTASVSLDCNIYGYHSNYIAADYSQLLEMYSTNTSGDTSPYNAGYFVNRAVADHDDNCERVGCDIGYYCSNKPIKMDMSDIDWDKFADDDVVTLSGDTIYDCVITNNNGDTSTINEYITNNYTYITNDGGGDGSGSGGSSSGGAVGGNVTVGGNIDVGGSVDVNVNVNGGSGDSMPVDVDLDNYLAQTPEQAQPITQFISIFFDFLPPELLGLICLGVAVAIILRIWGRYPSIQKLKSLKNMKF